MRDIPGIICVLLKLPLLLSSPESTTATVTPPEEGASKIRAGLKYCDPHAEDRGRERIVKRNVTFLRDFSIQYTVSPLLRKSDCSNHKYGHSILMKMKDLLSLFKKKRQEVSERQESSMIEEIFSKESQNLISLDRNYYEMVAEKIESFNGRIVSVSYEKDLGRLRIVYPSFYIDLATIDINLVDLLALFGLGLPDLELKITEKALTLQARLNDYLYTVTILGVNLKFDIENLS